VDGGDDIPPDRKDYVVTEINRLQALVGEVEVEAPEGSVIYVDGVLRGTAPVLTPVMVVGGKKHEIVIVHENQEILRQKFSVWGAKKIAIKAEKEKPGPVVAEPEPVEEPEPVAEEREEPIAPSEGLDPLYLWISLGGTAAFGAAALALELVISDKQDEYGDNGDPGVKEDGEALQPAGIAFVVLTGAALVTTGVLAIFTDFSSLSGEESADSTMSGKLGVTPWAGANSGGLEIRYVW